jgi:hypothetical protein
LVQELARATEAKKAAEEAAERELEEKRRAAETAGLELLVAKMLQTLLEQEPK